MRKKISPKTRAKVYEKYNGHCAYCGCKMDIKEMQVDHVDAVYKAEMKGDVADESMANYMPACRQCNFYKSTFDLETFRERLTSVMLENLKKEFNYKLAHKYGLIEEHIKPIVFYYETIKN